MSRPCKRPAGAALHQVAGAPVAPTSKSRRVDWAKLLHADSPPECALCDAIAGESVDLVEGGPVRWADYHWSAVPCKWNCSLCRCKWKGDLCFVCSRGRALLANTPGINIPQSNKLLRDSPHLFKLFRQKRKECLEAHVTSAQAGATGFAVLRSGSPEWTPEWK